MSPITSLFTNSTDPLGLSLLEEHRQRYEQIRAWRERQNDPHFSEVPVQWRREFEQTGARSKESGVRRQ